jgi:hypothetical protein
MPIPGWPVPVHLSAEGKSSRTTRTYTEAVTWFPVTRLLHGARRSR